MADLILTEELKQYQDLARDFATNEIAPHAHTFDLKADFPSDIGKRAWEIGLVNVRIPEELGGLGLPLLDSLVIAEELAAGCAGITSAILANDLAVSPLLVAGTIEQKKDFLEPLMSEFGLAAYCLSSGQEHSALHCKQNGDSYSLDGEGIVFNAAHCKWILFTLDNMAVIVPTGSAGTEVHDRTPSLGLKAADVRRIRFSNVKLSSKNVIRLDAAACKRISSSNDVQTAAYAIGIARCALQNAVQYSKERHTMGKPIGQHQAVGFMLADLARDTEASRLLAHKAAWLFDHGQPSAIDSATARGFALEATMRGTTDAVQVYGGYGYSREYPVEKLMRDAKSLQLLFGEGHAIKLHIGEQLVASCR